MVMDGVLRMGFGLPTALLLEVLMACLVGVLEAAGLTWAVPEVYFFFWGDTA
jgi:hypothetical protein